MSLSYLSDYKVPGHDLTICCHFMDGSDRDGARRALIYVQQMYGQEAALGVLMEMGRRQRERAGVIGGFLAAHGATGGDVDAALRSALASKDN